jgi:hypothetical protein
MKTPHELRLQKYREAKQRQQRPTVSPQGEPLKPVANRPLRSGDAIPGSRFFRAFCARCDEPMRVDYTTMRDNDGESLYCERCEPRPLTNVAATKDDTNPWGENAVRALEDQ